MSKTALGVLHRQGGFLVSGIRKEKECWGKASEFSLIRAWLLSRFASTPHTLASPMSANMNEPSLGTATSTDMEAQMELAIEVKVASWLKEKVAAEIVRPFLLI